VIFNIIIIILEEFQKLDPVLGQMPEGVESIGSVPGGVMGG
jgi:hypothetical protein